jgi:ankyrin repeat protein
MAETPELILAVQLKNLEKVQSLLDQEDTDVNITDSFGDSALHYASANNQLEILKLLIEKGANVNIQNNTGATPLHKAAGRDHRQIILHLLPLVDVTIKTNSGLLPEQFSSDSEIWKLIIGQNNLKREKIFVENEHLGVLIGKSGKNLQQMQTSSNTRIIIHKNNNNAVERGNTEVSITGREESITAAKELINDAIKPKPSKQEQLLEDENISHKVKVAAKIPRNKYGRIIGSKGRKIAEIEETFGVKVVIPKFDDDTVVNIYGDDSTSVQDALNFIFELIKDKDNNNNWNNNNRNNSSGNNRNNSSGNRNNNNNNGEGKRSNSNAKTSSPSTSRNTQVIQKDKNTMVIKTNNYLRINGK